MKFGNVQRAGWQLRRRPDRFTEFDLARAFHRGSALRWYFPFSQTDRGANEVLPLISPLLIASTTRRGCRHARASLVTRKGSQNDYAELGMKMTNSDIQIRLESEKHT